MHTLIKFLIVLVPGIIIFILCKIKSKYRYMLTGVFLLFVCILNVFYNSIELDQLIPIRKTTNQLIYQEENFNEGSYADALFNLIVEDKKVYVKSDQATMYDATVVKGFDWMYAIFHYHTALAYMKHYAAETVQDEELNNTVIDGKNKDDFTDLGFANDMMRSACIIHPDETEASDYFYHYWWFNERVGDMHLYANLDGILDADELVFLWQNVSEDSETEDFYLMTKDYYDRNFK